MKLIKKLIDWFEDLLWKQAIKDVFNNNKFSEELRENDR